MSGVRKMLMGCVVLLAGCHDSSFGERAAATPPAPTTTTLRELRRMFEGGTVVVESALTVRGRVTANDRSANFYRTFCIEDDGAGLEIMAGLDHLHNDYPEGSAVTVHLQGWALGESRGILQLGREAPATGGYPTDYIASRPALDRTVVRSAEALRPMPPTLCTLDELTPAMCGTLIRIEGVHYAPEPLSASGWSGEKRFTDDAGAEIYTYVRPYADFAQHPLPAGRCSLTGILQHDGNHYLLKLRDESDCTLQ